MSELDANQRRNELANEAASVLERMNLAASLENQELLGFTDLANAYLSFELGVDRYAVSILSVVEIRAWEEVSPIPNAPTHVLGMMNLRGAIVPVVDLRMCFAQTNLVYEKTTVVIIVSIDAKDMQKNVGIVVDAASDVCQIDEACDNKLIDVAPQIKGLPQELYVQRIIQQEDGEMLMLLKLNEQLFNVVNVNARN